MAAGRWPDPRQRPVSALCDSIIRRFRYPSEGRSHEHRRQTSLFLVLASWTLPPMCRARNMLRASRASSSSPPTKPLSAPARRRSQPSRACGRPIWSSIPDGHGGRSSGGPSPAAARPRSPRNILCGNGSDELLGLLCHQGLLSAPATRASISRARLPRLSSIADSSRRVARRSSCKEKDCTRRCRRVSSPPSRREDEDRLPRQPQQPDRHLSAGVDEIKTPPGRPAAARPARARRGLCRICPPQRLRGRALSSSPSSEQRGDDPHLLQGLRPRCNLRIGWMYAPAPISSTRSNRVRGPFNVNGAGDRRRCRRRPRPGASSKSRARPQRDLWLGKLDARQSSRSDRPHRHAVGHQLSC
jgi:hypothetical protein